MIKLSYLKEKMKRYRKLQLDKRERDCNIFFKFFFHLFSSQKYRLFYFGFPFHSHCCIYLIFKVNCPGGIVFFFVHAYVKSDFCSAEYMPHMFQSNYDTCYQHNQNEQLKSKGVIWSLHNCRPDNKQ